jgi:hypothetical protein
MRGGTDRTSQVRLRAGPCRRDQDVVRVLADMPVPILPVRSRFYFRPYQKSKISQYLSRWQLSLLPNSRRCLFLCRANVLEDGFIALQGFARPILADLRK